METKTYLHNIDEINCALNAYKDVKKALKKYNKLSVKLLSLKVFDSILATQSTLWHHVIDLIMNADISEERKDEFFARLEQIRENPFD